MKATMKACCGTCVHFNPEEGPCVVVSGPIVHDGLCDGVPPAGYVPKDAPAASC